MAYKLTMYRAVVIDPASGLEGALVIDAASAEHAQEICAARKLVTGPIEEAASFDLPILPDHYIVLECVGDGCTCIDDIAHELDESPKGVRNAVADLVAAGYVQQNEADALVDEWELEDLKEEAEDAGVSTKGGAKAIAQRLLDGGWSEKERNDWADILDALEITTKGEKLVARVGPVRLELLEANAEWNTAVSSAQRTARDEARKKARAEAEERKKRKKAERAERRRRTIEDTKRRAANAWQKFNRWMGEE